MCFVRVLSFYFILYILEFRANVTVRMDTILACEKERKKEE